jgi:hypothetical protein
VVSDEQSRTWPDDKQELLRSLESGIAYRFSDWPNESAPTVTAGVYTIWDAPTWLSRKEADVAPSNYRTLETAWRVHVQPSWGSTRIADVDLAAVERWVGTMRKKSGLPL